MATEDQNELSTTSPRGSTPVPDPTELTDRAIARLEKSMTTYIEGQLAIRDERLTGIDTATRLRYEQVTATHDATPELIDDAFASLEKLMNEKFDAAERLRVEQKKDTKDAVDAALSAAKEAVREQTAASEKSITKSELATGKQIDQLASTITTAIDGLRKSLDDLKEREIDDVRILRQGITDVAGIANGTVQQKVGAKEDRTGLYASVGILATVLGIAVVLAGLLARGV